MNYNLECVIKCPNKNDSRIRRTLKDWEQASCTRHTLPKFDVITGHTGTSSRKDLTDCTFSPAPLPLHKESVQLLRQNLYICKLMTNSTLTRTRADVHSRTNKHNQWAYVHHAYSNRSSCQAFKAIWLIEVKTTTVALEIHSTKNEGQNDYRHHKVNGPWAWLDVCVLHAVTKKKQLLL